jgi:hypothetical protein
MLSTCPAGLHTRLACLSVVLTCCTLALTHFSQCRELHVRFPGCMYAWHDCGYSLHAAHLILGPFICCAERDLRLPRLLVRLAWRGYVSHAGRAPYRFPLIVPTYMCAISGCMHAWLGTAQALQATRTPVLFPPIVPGYMGAAKAACTFGFAERTPYTLLVHARLDSCSSLLKRQVCDRRLHVLTHYLHL